MKQVIIHIGMPKTGATYLQNELHRNRHLLKNSGVEYLDVGLRSKHHIDIALGLEFSSGSGSKIDKISSTLELACQQINRSGSRTFVMSSVHFDINVTPASVRKTIETFGNDITVIVYLRNQIEFAQLLHDEQVSWGDVRSFSDFSDSLVQESIVDYLLKIELWANAGAKIIVKDYHHDKNNLYFGFLESVGIDLAKIRKMSIVSDFLGEHESLPPDANEFLRLYNANESSFEKRRANWFELRKLLMNAQPSDPMPIKLPISEKFSQKLNHYHTGNQEIVNRYNGPKSILSWDLAGEALQRKPQKEASASDFMLSNENILKGTQFASFELKQPETRNSEITETYKIFAPPGHFYSPIANLDEARLAISRADKITEIGGINLNNMAQLALLKKITPLLADCNFPEKANSDYRYYFQNDQYSYGDAIVYQAMLRHFRVSKIIEVGSGYSSAVALDTRDHFGYPKELLFIEPYPERLRMLLREQDGKSTQVFVERVQLVKESLFDTLGDGDILFIDSSHVAKTGSDLCHILFKIVPQLKSGVILHFHDCFWPFEYPNDWIINDARNWNELYFVQAFLMFNNRFEILFFNDYLAKKYPKECSFASPTFMRNPGGGLWLRVVNE